MLGLLPQPGGFEGLVAIYIEPPQRDQALLHRVDDGVTHIDPIVAAAQLAALMKRRHDLVRSGVKELLRAVVPIVKRLDPGGSPLKELIESVKLVSSHDGFWSVASFKDHIRREELVKRVNVGKALVDLDPSVETLPHDLHVLLRHRPPSISRRSAAFRPKRLLRQPGGFEGLLLFLVETDALDLAVADRDVSGQAGRSRLGPGEVSEVPLGRPIERFGREVDSKSARATFPPFSFVPRQHQVPITEMQQSPRLTAASAFRVPSVMKSGTFGSSRSVLARWGTSSTIEESWGSSYLRALFFLIRGSSGRRR